MTDRITTSAGDSTIYEGAGIEAFRLLVIAQGLELYAKTRMLPKPRNTSYQRPAEIPPKNVPFRPTTTYAMRASKNPWRRIRNFSPQNWQVGGDSHDLGVGSRGRRWRDTGDRG